MRRNTDRLPRDFQTAITPPIPGFGFKSIHIGKYILSIRADSASSCSPKQDGLAVDKYASFEINIWTVGEYMGDVKVPGTREYDSYWGENPTGEFVPKETVQKIYEHLIDIVE